MLQEFLDHIAREWGVITQAPMTFIAATLVMAALAYGASRWRFGGTIESLQHRLALKEDQLADYRDKLKGASPDEARARLDGLESRVEELRAQLNHALREDRFLMPDEARVLCDRLRKYAGTQFHVMVETNDRDPNSEQVRFGNQLASILTTAGWNQWNRPFPLYTRVSNRGLEIGFKADDQKSQRLAGALMSELRSFNVSGRLTPYTDIEASDALLITVGLR